MSYALQMSHTTDFGSTYSASYWRITDWRLVEQGKYVIVTISGWVDSTAYTDGKAAFASKTYTMDASTYLETGLPGGVTTMLEGIQDKTLDFIRTQSEFTTATKV